MDDKNVKRLILKENDVLIIHVPGQFLRNKEAVSKFYLRIKKTLHPRKNKILVIPTEMDLTVIGEKEVKEYVSNMDIWDLWEINNENEEGRIN